MYTDYGEKISKRATLKANMARIEVTDTGIGINPEEQTYLFNQFFRSEHPTEWEQQGWGLGLSVAKRLVDLMGGEIGIGIRSTLGVGSTFYFGCRYPNMKPKPESGTRHPLLLYRRTMDRLWPVTLLMGLLLAALWGWTLFSDLRLVTPFLRINISYRRIRSVHQLISSSFSLQRSLVGRSVASCTLFTVRRWSWLN